MADNLTEAEGKEKKSINEDVNCENHITHFFLKESEFKLSYLMEKSMTII